MRKELTALLVRLTAEFDSAYQADRAYARIKARGIPCGGMKTHNYKPLPQPALFITSPYPRHQNSFYNNQSFGLPETTGTSIMMTTPLLDSFGEDIGRSRGVELEVMVDKTNEAAAKRILINNGGRKLRID